tara:strand:- start:11133 stop:11366 length:234 start_codon:yes stop_codon:yes gene_type:complete
VNKTIGNHDLITAENIMAYLQARRDELEKEYTEEQVEGELYLHVPLTILKGRLHEVHELLTHVEGDLDSMIKDLMDQ